MFVRDQFYWLKQSVGSTKNPEYDGSDLYIKVLIKQLNKQIILKNKNKIKNSIIQSLLYQNPSSATNSQMKNNNNNNSSSFSHSVDVA